MDFETACFAIHEYAARKATYNLVAGRGKAAGDLEGLGEQRIIASAPPDILPEEESQHAEKWTRIIEWFRNQLIGQDEEPRLWTEHPSEQVA